MDAFLVVFIQEVLPLSKWCKPSSTLELASPLSKRRPSLARVADLRHFVVGWLVVGWLAAGRAAVDQERMGRGSGRRRDSMASSSVQVEVVVGGRARMVRRWFEVLS